MPSCCTILCRPLTARTDYRTHDCLAIRNFLTTLGNFFRGFKKIMMMIIHTFLYHCKVVTSEAVVEVRSR